MSDTDNNINTDVYGLYIMNFDGSDLRRIAKAPFLTDHAWSPDGRRIVFHGFGSGLYIANADGSGQKRLSAYGGQAAWSLDGRKIAYARGAGGPGPTVMVMNANGSRKRPCPG